MRASNFEQNTRTAAPSNQSIGERPEQPDRPERPERPEGATVLSGQQLGDQIRNDVRQSLQGAARALSESKEIQQAVRDAQRHVRDAERQVRDASSPAERAAAAQDLAAARTELSSLQSISPTVAYAIQPQMMPHDIVPPQAVDISIAFFIMIAVIIIGWPLARAFARRLERRGDTPSGADPAMAGQLQRIEQAVEAMSIEIERISESQRFMVKLQSGASAERAALGTSERR
jgi:hypothetical protein